MNTPPSSIPEFIRLPKTGKRCPICGLSRSTLLRLCSSGVIRSKVLRQPGRLRGIRLIITGSLLCYLRGLPDASQGVYSVEE